MTTSEAPTEVKLLPRSGQDKSFFPPPTSEERELLERLLVSERHIADLRARQATLAEAVRWAAHITRGMELKDVAEMLETLLPRP